MKELSSRSSSSDSLRNSERVSEMAEFQKAAQAKKEMPRKMKTVLGLYRNDVLNEDWCCCSVLDEDN